MFPLMFHNKLIRNNFKCYSKNAKLEEPEGFRIEVRNAVGFLHQSLETEMFKKKSIFRVLEVIKRGDEL